VKAFDLYEQARVKNLREYAGDLSVRRIHDLDVVPEEGAKTVGYRVHNLAHDLQKEMPQLRFSRKTRNSMHVYHPDETFTRGWIGYGNYYHVGGEEKYVLRAPSIINNRYAGYSNQHHMAMSKNVGTLIRQCKAHLVRVTTEQVNSYYFHDFKAGIEDSNKELRAAILHLQGELGISAYGNAADVLLTELETLRSEGHEFSVPSINKTLDDIKEARAFNKDSKVSSKGALIWQDGTKFRAVNVETYDTTRWKSIVGSEQVYPTQDDIPAHVLDKLFKLQIAKERVFLPDVGLRCSEDVSYVQTSV